MAENIVNHVAEKLQAQSSAIVAGCKTKKLSISGGDYGGSELFPSFLRNKVREGIALGLPEKKAEQLTYRYGSNVDHIYANIRLYKTEAIKKGLPIELLGELLYTMEYEMVTKPEDFFIRRTGALFFDINWVNQWKDPVIAFMAHRLQWSNELKQRYIEDLNQYIKDAITPVIQ